MKKTKLPSKKTLNLVVKVKTLAHPTRLIPILLLIFLGVGIFTEFAVIRRIEKVRQAEAELAEMRRNLEMIQSAYADYDEVEAEYNRYTYDNYDRTLFDRLDVLALLERQLFPVCTVQSLNISGQTISMTVQGPTLEQMSDILTSLRNDPMVDGVYMSSYTDNSESSGGSGSSTAVLTITLADATVYAQQMAEAEAAANAAENPDDGAEEAPDALTENGGDE